ncbi:MAG: DUF3095 domain-containing protein [Calditrichia bacterium]
MLTSGNAHREVMMNADATIEFVQQESATEQFYAKLPAFHNFEDLCRAEYYSPVPENWHIVVSDIENSTVAIQKGHYRQVNSIGVASIISVINALKPVEIPYAFGGDGAVLCIPPKNIEKVKEALVGTKLMAATEFDLNLRIGIVPVGEIYELGEQVLLGKYRISDHCVQAMFQGNGLVLAEKLVKSDVLQRFTLRVNDAAPLADFTGFECRWQDVPSPHEEIVSILVQACGDSVGLKNSVYTDVLNAISRIYGSEEHYRPLHLTNLRLKTRRKQLHDEIRIRTMFSEDRDRKSYIRNLPWKNRFGKVLMAMGINTRTSNWKDYKSTLIANSDFRKFDNLLRMVISGTASQRLQMMAFLDKNYQRKRLFYGIHTAPKALVTCVVSDYRNDHFHFVDSADGGYAMAATVLKKQIAENKYQR